jgi:hypothetical protein
MAEFVCFLIQMRTRIFSSEIYWPLISQIIHHTVKITFGLSFSPEFDSQCEQNSEHKNRLLGAIGIDGCWIFQEYEQNSSYILTWKADDCWIVE